MQSRRATVTLLLLLALVLASGLWLWRRLAPPELVRPPLATPTVALAVAVATRTPLRPPPGYRLAGVAVGEPDSFAVIEAPNGMSALYRLNADVPGLGRLLRIEAERIVVQSTAGQLEMWIAPAPTATPAKPRPQATRPQATRPPATRPPAARLPVAGTPTAKLLPPPPGAGTAGGSTPSSVPDRPAS